MLSSFLGGACTFAALHFCLEARAEDQKPEKVLKAQRFEIVDADDKTIGYLGAPLKKGEDLGLLFYANGGLYEMGLTQRALILTGSVNNICLGEIEDQDTKKTKYRITIQNGKEVWTQP